MTNRDLKILIVDDEKSIRDLYAKIISYNGFKISGFAKNGEEAVKLFKKLNPRPDIILMDYHMPIKNGLDAAKEILKTDNSVQIFLISGGDYHIAEKINSINNLDFYSKPLTIKNLIKIICKHYQNKKNRKLRRL